MSAPDPKEEMEQLMDLGKDLHKLSGLMKKDSKQEANWQWLSPMDQRITSVSAQDIARELKRQDKHLLKDIIAACRDKGRKVLLQFSPPNLKDIPNCPDLDDIKIALVKESYFTTVHNLNGYNYSVEYAHIYRARSDKSFFPLDVFTVCQRGLLTIDPFLKKELAAEYADFMIRASYWEYVKVKAFANHAMAETFPDVLATAGDLAFGSTRIYIGQHPSTSALCFFIRTTCSLKSVSDSTGDEREEEADAAEKFTFATYKRYDLTPAAIEAADELMSFADSGESGGQKSTSVSSGDESTVYLIVRSDGTEAVASTTEEQDELEDVDGGGMTAAAHEGAEANDQPVALTEHVFNNAASRHPSPCSELVVWGQNAFLATGTKDQTISEPWPMARPLSLCLEIVKMVACSARHTLVLTTLGLVYSCGDNTEGALGSGDVDSRQQLQVLSQWYSSVTPTSTDGTHPEPKLADNPPIIVKIAAAAGIIGSHSVALDEHGNLYSWGVAQATGHGVMKPVLSPRQIDTFPVPQSASKGDPMERVHAEKSARTFYYTRGVRSVSDVACGSGFTSCVLRETGEVCCWGIWQHGRLGRPVPIIQTSTGRRRLFRSSAGGGDGKKTYARYQLRPLLVPGISNAVSVACGDAHTLCKTKEGYLLAWGQNSCGQLGTGVTRSGFLRDNYRPTYVAPFCPPTSSSDDQYAVGSGKKVSVVGCGTFHSAVVEEGGAVWTWGARGHACIGHDDAPIVGPWAKKIQVIFSGATNTTKLMIPYELIPWCSTWSVPRCLDSLANKFRDAQSGSVIKCTRIVQISCGDMHSAFLSASGRVFLCGDGPVVPPIVSVPERESNEESEIEEEEVEETEVVDQDSNIDDSKGEEKKKTSASPKKAKPKDSTADGNDNGFNTEKKTVPVTNGIEAEEEKPAALPDAVSMIHIPRCPSSAWLPRLATRRTLLIASAGTHMFALQDDDMVSSSLSKKVYLTLQSEQEQVQYAEDLGAKVIPVPGTEEVAIELDDDEGDFTDISLRGDASSTNRSNRSLFEQRGCADCMLISSGKILLAHRAVLAARSPVLRDKLVEEAPGGDDFNQPTQILLPELLHGTARVLLQFLYTDNLPKRVLGNPSMLRNLARAAVQLKLPRLQIICHQLLQLHTSSSKSNIRQTDIDGDGTTSRTAGIGVEVVPATLARDFGSIVGDPQYADVRFIAEGRTLFAHRAILEARSVYFRSMFRSGMMESFVVNGKPTDIVVPDTFVCLLRMMIFLYTDILPEGSDSALLEDLLTADRYQISDMRCLCENMLVPTKHNWMELLQVAESIHSSRLKHETIGFLRSHLGDAYVSGSIDESFDQFPDVLESILKMRQIAFPTPPSKLLIEQITTNVKLEEEKNKVDFPWVGLVVIFVVGFTFTYLVRVSNLGAMVPWFNGIMMAGVLLYAYKRVLSM